jgi:hypothetical protein
MQHQRCPNDNHGRSVVTIRCCPNCGAVVNGKILARSCAPETHASLRRSRNAFCLHCGDRLLQLR